jgi:hypothetical protein
MLRRTFLKNGLGLAAVCALPQAGHALAPNAVGMHRFFSTSDRRWQAAYDKAERILSANVQRLPLYDRPVLIEGADYAGIWQECGPHEALVYHSFRPGVARNSHDIFFALQRPDGQLPANSKRSETGFGQIQMVVPIAATAWELAQTTGDSRFLERAYAACERWDAWLTRYRNTRGTGLIEGFCTYDTGMDNSPRWAGIPVRCPDKDAKRMPPIATLPRLCPDLSATVYGARSALAAMAAALGKQSDADIWRDRAEKIRRLILERLYLPDDAVFYDLDAQNRFVRVRSDILTRVCGERVVDQKIFEQMWQRQLGNPQAFWPPYPFPSIALNDSVFVRPIPPNSWGGASQALTALRATRWMDHYGRSAELAHLMDQWCRALRHDMTFRQQLDPLNGAFTWGGSTNYSPASLAMIEFTWRLAGVREEGEELHWNIRPGVSVSRSAYFQAKLRYGTAAIRYRKRAATLALAGRLVAEVHGTARLVTDTKGKPLYLLGISMTAQAVTLHLPGKPRQRISLLPNQRYAVNQR